MANAKLLSEPTNYAIVQLPGRQFPGIVFQGDSLSCLIADLREAATETNASEAALALNDVIDRLANVLKRYEEVLDREGIPTPYTRSHGSY